MESAKISSLQFTILVISYIIGDSIINAPSMLASFAKTNAWISSLLGLLFGLLVVWLFITLSTTYPGDTLIDMNKKAYGKLVGSFISMIYLFALFVSAAANLREVGDFFTTQVMVETPIQVIHLLMIFAVIFIVRHGVEVIARTCEIFFPYVVVMLCLLLLMLIPEIKPTNLVPDLSKGIAPILGTTFSYIGYSTSNSIVFLMILPYVNTPTKGRKGFFIGLLVGGLCLSLITAMCLSVLGANATGRNSYPTYVLAKKVSIGDFLQRIEVIVAISWLFTIFFKIVITVYAIALGIAQLLNLKNYRAVTFALGFFLMTYAMVFFPNTVFFDQFWATTWSLFSFIVFIVLSVILLVISVLKRKIPHRSLRM